MTPIFDALGIHPSVLGSLPPDVRDHLLAYVATWEEPDHALALVEMLREAHGPLLFLLDVQAAALLAQGETRAALEINERRQRRSSTIDARVFEARCLLQLGQSDAAARLAADIATSSPNAQAARLGAASVLVETGSVAHGEHAIGMLQQWLKQHPGDAAATLCLAQAALAAGNQTLAVDMADRLGPGIPADLPSEQLPAFAALLERLGRTESARAAANEHQRRRVAALEQLRAETARYTALDPDAGADAGAIYRLLNGPESVPASSEEVRRVRLEAIRHFGHNALREGQIEAIASVLRGESLLLVMPTGAGKSLCYQLPGLILPRASLIISPLIALMKDQVDSLPPAARKSATFINSTLSEEEMEERMAGVARGRYKLIYAAPERLRQRAFLRALRKSGIDLFVIDEAHCISLWGHDFRPDYLFLQEARRELGNPTTLALTATAPPRVRDEIIDYMRAEADTGGGDAGAEPRAKSGPRVITLDIFRSNLQLSAIRLDNEEQKFAAVRKFISETPGAGIVYVSTRQRSETLAWELRGAGIAAEAYHAGLADRGAIQDRFMSGATRVIVATVAFGMGIDKADIRFIVHFHPSQSLAAYYQEVGRAGRDGLPSQGVLFYSNNDWANLRRWAQTDEIDIPFLTRVYTAIVAQLAPASASMAARPEQGGDPAESPTGGLVSGGLVSGGLAPEGLVSETVSGAVDAGRLQRVLNSDETTVRVAVSLLERADLLTRSFDVAQEATLEFPPTLPAAARVDPDFRDFVRMAGLRPGKQQMLSIAEGAARMGWSHADFEGVLLEWQAAGWLLVKFSRRALFIDLPPTPADLRTRLDRLLSQTHALSQRRIDDMVGYATTEGCRHGYISAHFGSPPRTRCTVCDNCTGQRPDLPVFKQEEHLLPDDADIEPMIIDCLISLPHPVGRSGLARILIGHGRANYTPDAARHHSALKALGEGGVIAYIDKLLASARLRQFERRGFLVLGPTLAGRAEAETWRAQHPELAMYGEAPAPPDAPEGATSGEAPSPGDSYTNLQKALWLWRRRLAAELGQPPYIVMSNELMLQIAESRPRTLEELGALHGMGMQRLTRYGPTILDLILLTPPAEGDDALLQAQRRALAEARLNRPSSSAPDRTPTVPSAMQRQIRMKLEEIRQRIAVQGNYRLTEVATTTLISTIAAAAPLTLDALDAIPGFRSSGMNREGPQIVTFIAALRAREKNPAPE